MKLKTVPKMEKRKVKTKEKESKIKMIKRKIKKELQKKLMLKTAKWTKTKEEEIEELVKKSLMLLLSKTMKYNLVRKLNKIVVRKEIVDLEEVE